MLFLLKMTEITYESMGQANLQLYIWVIDGFPGTPYSKFFRIFRLLLNTSYPIETYANKDDNIHKSKAMTR